MDDARRLRYLTKKKLKTCKFVLAYHHRNFQKALEMLTGEPKLEDGR